MSPEISIIMEADVRARNGRQHSHHHNRETDDIVVVAMTSNLKPADYGFVITSEDLKLEILMRPNHVHGCSFSASFENHRIHQNQEVFNSRLQLHVAQHHEARQFL